MSRAALLAAALARSSGVAPPPWPWSWERISTFGFPGASPRFMNATELAHFSNFSMATVWGIGGECVNTTTGALFAPSCPGSWCDCLPANARNKGYEEQRWVLAMDANLQAQSAALKAAARARGRPPQPVLGYFNLDVAQQWYGSQFAFCYNASFAPLRLATAARGVIDCFRDGCDYVGMEYCMYDFRQAAARAYWVETVLPALIDSPDIDGVFLDECDELVNVHCPRWGCTAQELADLTAGTLQLLDAALAKAASLGKWLSISLKSTLDNNRPFLEAVLASIQRHGAGFRYYEFFKSEADLEAFIYEAQTLRIPVQVHAETFTMNPDLVELAIFLIGAGEYSYFSFSWAWTFADFPWLPAYDEPLGAPLGPPRRSNVSQPVAPWAALNSTNLVCGLVPSPGDSGANFVFLGNFTRADACAAAARANASFASWTHVGRGLGDWSNGCYARLDGPPLSCLPPGGGGCGAPCYAASEPAMTAAVNYPFNISAPLWTRDFEHVHVEYEPLANAARITQRALGASLA